jgi:hypothetical protein
MHPVTPGETKIKGAGDKPVDLRMLTDWLIKLDNQPMSINA